MSTDDVRRLRGLIKAIATNPHMNLGDAVYSIREREGLGWNGPSVKAWSDAVAGVEMELQQPDCVDHTAEQRERLDDFHDVATMAATEEIVPMNCARCASKLDFTTAKGQHEIDGKRVCDDCYWDSFWR